MKHCRFCLFLFLLGFCRMVGAQEINSGILNVSEDSVAAQKSFFTRVIDFFRYSQLLQLGLYGAEHELL